MDTVIDKKPAIIVDFSTWSTSADVKDLIAENENVVLLVDYGDEYEWKPGDPDWQAVIRNNGKMDELTFKTAALCLVQDSGTLVKAIAIDDDHDVRNMYYHAGTPVVFNEYLVVTRGRGEFAA